MTGFFNICTRDNVSLSFQAWDREMSMHFKDYFQKELRLSSQFPAFSIQLCPNCSSARTKEGSVEEGQVLVSSGHCWQLFSRTSNGQPGRLLLYLLQTALNSMGSNLLHCFFLYSSGCLFGDRSSLSLLCNMVDTLEKLRFTFNTSLKSFVLWLLHKQPLSFVARCILAVSPTQLLWHMHSVWNSTSFAFNWELQEVCISCFAAGC